MRFVDRLDQSEADDERKHGTLRGEAELPFRHKRQDRPLETYHPADERVDDDEQRELSPISSETQYQIRLRRRD